MSKIKENIEDNQDELGGSLLEISKRIKIIKVDLNKKGISEDEEDKLGAELLGISKTIKNIKKTLADLEKMLDIFDEIEKSKNKPESKEYKDAIANAEEMKLLIMGEYKMALIELNKELNKVNFVDWFNENKNEKCDSNKKCGTILEDISKDADFKSLTSDNDIKELQTKLTNLGLQSGGSKQHKIHKTKQTNDLIYW